MGDSKAIAAEKQTIWSKAFLNIFFINVLLSLAQFMASTLLPKYVESLGATATVIGMVSGIFAITAISVRPIVGPATTYFKKNYLLAMTIVLIILAFLCYGFSHAIPLIIAGRLLHGMGMGFLAPVNLSLASNALPEGKISSGIGIFTLGQAISSAIGPTVGLEMSKIFGYNATFLLTVTLLAVVLVMALLLKTEEPDRSAGFKISWDKVVALEGIIPAILLFFISGAYSSVGSFLVVYGGACGVEDIGLYFTAYAVTLLFTRPVSGRIADKYGSDRTIIPGIAIFAFSQIFLSFAHTLPMFILAGILSAFGFGICSPSIQAMGMQLVSKERRGVAGNTMYLGIDASYLVMPTLAGSIVTFEQNHGGTKISGYMTMYRFMVIPVLIALVIFLLSRKKLKPVAAEGRARTQ